MMLYRACKTNHWRHKYIGEWQAQAFFHYVDANRPYAKDHKFDGRLTLGVSKNHKSQLWNEQIFY